MLPSLIGKATNFGERLRRSVESLNSESVGKAYAARDDYYSLLEKYYANEVYERTDAQSDIIKGWAGLPRTIRPIALIAKRAVDWWPGQVYGGKWTNDGLPTDAGVPNRIPYENDTPEDLRLAVQQAFTWGNGTRFLSRMVHTGAKLGDVFAEVELHWSDDGQPGNKVYPVLIHPRHVVGLDLSPRGDVQGYRLAIPRWDVVARQSYLWGKKVTKDDVTTYYNDEPYGYDDQDAVIPNPYGFVPAVWSPHMVVGGPHGAPAIDGIMATLDEYQGLLSTIDDYIHRFVRQGVAVASKNPELLASLLRGDSNKGLAGVPSHLRNMIADQERQQINIFPMPEEATFHHMLVNLGLGDAGPHIDRIVHEIELALPEIVLSEKLLEMTQVTRPGAMPLVQKVKQKLNDVTENYDHSVVKIGQMCAAIGGHHASNGDWGLGSQLTAQQALFTPFDLDSYAAGLLGFSLKARELIPTSMGDLAAEATAIEALRTPTGLRHVGFSEEEIYGEGNVPVIKPGILEETGPATAAGVGNAFAAAFNQGVVTPV